MKHAREDYNRFQDPDNKIPEDEPVMLFRAQDIHFVKVLQYYQHLLKESKNFEVAKAVDNHIDTTVAWRTENGIMIKEPDL